MSANILDPRMIDPTKPLSCSEIKATTFTVQNTLVTNLTSTAIKTSSLTSINITATAANINQSSIDQAFIKDGTFTGTVVTNFTAQAIDSSIYYFTNSDNSKVYHFDTDTQPSMTAVFLSGNIASGFNVGILNTGLGVIYLSSDFSPTINAANTFNSVRYSGMYIYRVNNQLFGVGVFE